jgi:hypothetical protein
MRRDQRRRQFIDKIVEFHDQRAGSLFGKHIFYKENMELLEMEMLNNVPDQRLPHRARKITSFM